MDIDRFIARNEPSWHRLDELTRRGTRSIRSLSTAELDELVALYQRTSAHLSMVRTQFDDIALANRLSHSLGSARGLIYRRKAKPGVAAGRFFSETFPAAVWTCRRSIGVAAIVLFGPALAMGIWLSANGNAREAAVSPRTQQLIADHQFADYYKSESATPWAFELWTHNIEVAVLAFAGGALLGAGTVYMLLLTGANTGMMAAVMYSHGKGAVFWGLIAPHGLLELSAVTMAAGAGLRLAWTMIAPGDRTRAEALAEEGLRAVAIVLGTMLCFVVAGFIEAFVTPSSLPTAARVGIGVLVELLLLIWVVGVGRSATSRGLSGRFGETARPTGPPSPEAPAHDGTADHSRVQASDATGVPSISA